MPWGQFSKDIDRWCGSRVVPAFGDMTGGPRRVVAASGFGLANGCSLSLHSLYVLSVSVFLLGVVEESI